jgi:hypothetical protein
VFVTSFLSAGKDEEGVLDHCGAGGGGGGSGGGGSLGFLRAASLVFLGLLVRILGRRSGRVVGRRLLLCLGHRKLWAAGRGGGGGGSGRRRGGKGRWDYAREGFGFGSYVGLGLTTDDLGFPHRMAPEPLMSVQASVTICSPVWGTAESRRGGGAWAVPVRGAASGAMGGGRRRRRGGSWPGRGGEEAREGGGGVRVRVGGGEGSLSV